MRKEATAKLSDLFKSSHEETLRKDKEILKSNLILVSEVSAVVARGVPVGP
jgi:hypothetical protein